MLRGDLRWDDTASAARARTMYMATYKAMYMALYKVLRAAVRVHPRRQTIRRNTRRQFHLDAISVRLVPGNRNLAFRSRNLASWVRNLAIRGRNLALSFRNLAIVLKGRKDLRQTARLRTRFLMPYTCARVYARAGRNGAHRSSGKITRITS